MRRAEEPGHSDPVTGSVIQPAVRDPKDAHQSDRVFEAMYLAGQLDTPGMGIKEELGIVTSIINTARGTGRVTPLAWRGIGEAAEKDVLRVISTSFGG